MSRQIDSPKSILLIGEHMPRETLVCGFPPTSARASAQQDCRKAESQVIKGAEPKSWGSLYRLFSFIERGKHFVLLRCGEMLE